MKTRAEALLIKPGPTQSGGHKYQPVGGEVLQIDKMSLVWSQELLLILLIVIPLALFLFYKKPSILLKLLSFLNY